MTLLDCWIDELTDFEVWDLDGKQYLVVNDERGEWFSTGPVEFTTDDKEERRERIAKLWASNPAMFTGPLEEVPFQGVV